MRKNGLEVFAGRPKRGSLENPREGNPRSERSDRNDGKEGPNSIG
jgi:hypothetical protein